MKIAVLADFYPPLNRGGAGVVAQRLARAFSAQGHRILIVASAQSPGAAGRQNDGDIEIVRLPLSYPERLRNVLGIHNPAASRLVRRELARFGPDLVHAHNVHRFLSFGSLGAAPPGTPVVLTSHDYLMFCCDRLQCTGGPRDFKPRQLACLRFQRLRYNPARRALIRRLASGSVQAIIAISDVMRRALETNGFRGVTTIHNGLDPEEWPFREPSRRRSGQDGEARPVALLPGRLSSYKGTEALLDAVALLPPGARPTVVFAGDNPRYEPELLARARRLGIADLVRITGWLDPGAMSAELAAADVVVTPSTYPDPFNLGNIEAMSTGRPVIASSLGGAPEIVVEGDTGFLVDPGDPELFARRLALLLEDPDLRRAYGDAGRRRVLQRFTLERQAESTMQVYEKALGR